jgi:hypothetical protein
MSFAKDEIDLALKAENEGCSGCDQCLSTMNEAATCPLQSVPV